MNTTKGRAVKEEHGLCKLLIAPDHKILGCHIVGYQASVLLHAVIPIMKWRNDIHSLADIIYIHPSLAESGPWRGQESRRNVADQLPGHVERLW